MGSRGSEFKSDELYDRVNRTLTENPTDSELFNGITAERIVDDAKKVRDYLKKQQKAEQNGVFENYEQYKAFREKNPFPTDSLQRLGRYTNAYREKGTTGISGFNVSHPINLHQSDYDKIEEVLGVKLRPTQKK